MHCVVETEAYVRAAKASDLTDDDRHKIVTFVSDNPDAGDIIKGTGGARKLRFPFRSKGKSGGIRVVTFYSGDDIPVFLLDVFSKGDRINLSQSERNELRSVLGAMATSYRAANEMKIAQLLEKRA